MRIAIEITDELLRQAKKKATAEGTALRQVIETALRFYLAKPRRRAGYKLRWRTKRGQMLPGVRLDDRDALFDLMRK